MAAQPGKKLTGMPKTDLSPWLTSPLDMMKVVQEIDATTKKKRGDGEVSRRNTGDEKKKKREGAEGGEKYCRTRVEANAGH